MRLQRRVGAISTRGTARHDSYSACSKPYISLRGILLRRITSQSGAGASRTKIAGKPCAKISRGLTIACSEWICCEEVDVGIGTRVVIEQCELSQWNKLQLIRMRQWLWRRKAYVNKRTRIPK
jgi:hypothetical protein